MSDPDIKEAIRQTALIAFESIERLSDQQAHAVLVTIVEAGTDAEAAAAEAQIYHRSEARKAQMQLRSIVEGIGK